MLARYRAGIITSNGTCHFSTAVDCRSRLNLPSPYLGNAIDSIKISITLAKLAPNHDSVDDTELPGLNAAAHAIRGGINEITPESFRDLIAFVERTDREQLVQLSIAGDLATSGMPTILPRARDGSCDFGLSERVEVMSFLEKDPVFATFARRL